MSTLKRYLLFFFFFFFFFNDTATTEIYTLSLHDALPISNAPALPHHGPFFRRRAEERQIDAVRNDGSAALGGHEKPPRHVCRDAHDPVRPSLEQAVEEPRPGAHPRVEHERPPHRHRIEGAAGDLGMEHRDPLPLDHRGDESPGVLDVPPPTSPKGSARLDEDRDAHCATF